MHHYVTEAMHLLLMKCIALFLKS